MNHVIFPNDFYSSKTLLHNNDLAIYEPPHEPILPASKSLTSSLAPPFMYNIHTITIYIVVNNHSTTLFFTILLCVNLLRASFLASPANLFGRPRQAAKDSLTSQKWRGHCRRPPNCMSQLTIKGEKYRGGGFAFPPSQRLLPQIIPRSNLSYPPRDDPFMTHKLPPFLGGSLYGKDSRCGTWGNLYILTTSKRRDASPCTAKRC